MKVFRGFQHAGLAPACALTIGNFDGVHRGHQAMLALLRAEGTQRGVPSCVLTFEPHPRDYFATLARRADIAPARVGTVRDKLLDLAQCGVDQVIVLPFRADLAALRAEVFVQDVLVQGLGARYVLVGDDFRFGSARQGDYALLDKMGNAVGFDVARMNSYEVHGLRVSSSAVRAALAEGRMDDAAALLGRPYAISGRAVHGRKLGRELGFRTLNLRFQHPRPAAMGIFVVQVHGLGPAGSPGVPGVASLGVRPTVEDAGRVLLEVHCLDWPAHLGAEGGYGRLLRVELLHKLHDELKYDSLQALQEGIARDTAAARDWWRARA